MLRGRHTPNILESQQRTACECSKGINKQKYKTPLLMNTMLPKQFRVEREAVRKKEARSIKVVPQNLPPTTACTALFAVQANSWECFYYFI